MVGTGLEGRVEKFGPIEALWCEGVNDPQPFRLRADVSGRRGGGAIAVGRVLEHGNAQRSPCWSTRTWGQ